MRARAMGYDVDLMRELLFELEGRQTSPRSTVVISLDAEAIALGRTIRDVEAGLEGLLDLDYIDGPAPGPDTPGFFLFRKLTRKGAQFVRMTQSPSDWERLKRRFARPGLPDGASQA